MISEECSRERTLYSDCRHTQIVVLHMQIGQIVQSKGGLLLDIVFLLEGILLCRKVKSKLSLNQVQNQVMGLYLVLYLSLNGYKISDWDGFSAQDTDEAMV